MTTYGFVKLKEPKFYNYEVNAVGQVRNWNTGRPIKSRITQFGYVGVTLSHKNKSLKVFVHRLVAFAFIPNPENRRCVNHINGIKTDNRVENLEWCTHSENSLHSYAIGLRKGQMTQIKPPTLSILLSEGVPLKVVANLLGVKMRVVQRFAGEQGIKQGAGSSQEINTKWALISQSLEKYSYEELKQRLK